MLVVFSRHTAMKSTRDAQIVGATQLLSQRSRLFQRLWWLIFVLLTNMCKAAGAQQSIPRAFMPDLVLRGAARTEIPARQAEQASGQHVFRHVEP